MHRPAGLILLLMLTPALAPAQDARHSEGQAASSYVYLFTGPVVVPRSAFTRWNGDFIHVGGGGEARITDRFALGGELGLLKPITNQQNAITFGLGSVTPAFHFIGKNSMRRFDPFVNGGFSLLAGKGGAIALHYGGGMNYWVHRRIGLRAEFRDHVWSPESGEAIHLVGFRFGIVIGI